MQLFRLCFIKFCLFFVSSFGMLAENLYLFLPNTATSSLSTIDSVNLTKIRCAVMCSQNSDCCNFHYIAATGQCLFGKVEECLGSPMTVSGWKYYKKGSSFGNKLYFYFDVRKTWANAKTACRDLGMTLVSIESEQENAFVKSIAKVVYGKATWIGANDIAQEGTWIWEGTGQALSYTNWWLSTGQPNGGTGSNCMCFYAYSVTAGAPYHWADEPCGFSYTYVCETI